MRNKLLLLFLLLSLTATAQFQQAVIGSLGGEIAAADGSISFTQSVGDVAGTFVYTEFGTTDNPVNFSQGFVQCFACDDCPFLVSVTGLTPGLEELVVYPNPTSGRLEISGDNDRIHRYQVVDATGRQVLTGRFLASNVDLSPYPPGFYILRLFDQDGQGLATVKVVRR